MKIKPRFVFPLLVLLASVVAADIQPHGGMMRYPDVSATHIVFVYADDIWLVSRSGGTASPLASPSGGESFPRFSADGRTIAFNGNYDGNHDIYTVPVAGGIPRRVTYHSSGERLCDWSFDNHLVFAMAGLGGLGRQTQLFEVPQAGGLPQRLPVPYGGYGTLTMEGHGVDPDIEVVDDPALMTEGGDPQLDAAIAHMLKRIKKKPYVPAPRPPYPDRSGMGILEENK